MAIKKQVLIELSTYDGYQVSVSNNGIQWNVIYCNVEFKNAKIILDAFKKVGYEDVIDYEDLEIKDASGEDRV